MKYTEDYLRSRDIDWFCVIDGIYVHIASAGGLLPVEINDMEILRSNQRFVCELADIFTEEEIEVNRTFLAARFGNQDGGNQDGGNQATEYYLESFLSMARKGFVSLDRTNLADQDDNTYHVVCKPQHPRQISGLEDLCEFTSRTTDLLKQVRGGIALLDELTLIQK